MLDALRNSDIHAAAVFDASFRARDRDETEQTSSSARALCARTTARASVARSSAAEEGSRASSAAILEEGVVGAEINAVVRSGADQGRRLNC